MERHNGIEFDPEGAFVYYDDAQRALDAERRERRAVEQIAGQALGYPWFKDDQKNFPGATEADGVCIGEHVAGTIVQELASKRATLQADNECKDSLIETLQAQLRQVEGERDHAKKMEAVQKEVADNQTWHVQTLRQLVAALPVVEVDGVIVWAAPDESGWFVSKRPAPTGTYWAKFKTQEDAKSFLALLKSRATLAAQDAGQGGLQ